MLDACPLSFVPMLPFREESECLERVVIYSAVGYRQWALWTRYSSAANLSRLKKAGA